MSTGRFEFTNRLSTRKILEIDSRRLTRDGRQTVKLVLSREGADDVHPVRRPTEVPTTLWAEVGRFLDPINASRMPPSRL